MFFSFTAIVSRLVITYHFQDTAFTNTTLTNKHYYRFLTKIFLYLVNV